MFGHLFSILTTPLRDDRLSATVKRFQNLVELCENIDKEYFDRPSSSGSSEDTFEKVVGHFPLSNDDFGADSDQQG